MQNFGRPFANNRSSLKMLNLFLIFTFTPETFYGSVVLKWLNQIIIKIFSKQSILLLVIKSNGNFVSRQLPELEDGDVDQLLCAERTQREGGLADLFIFRMLTDVWRVEISLPLDRGTDVSFQETTSGFSGKRTNDYSEERCWGGVSPENWYQELAQRGIDHFILYDLANCSLLAIFILQIKRREEKINPLQQRMGRLFLSAGLALLPARPSLPPLEVCVEADGGQEDGDGEGQEKIWNDVDVIEVVVVEVVVTSRSW